MFLHEKLITFCCIFEMDKIPLDKYSLQADPDSFIRKTAAEGSLSLQNVVGPMADYVEIFSGVVSSGSAFRSWPADIPLQL